MSQEASGGAGSKAPFLFYFPLTDPDTNVIKTVHKPFPLLYLREFSAFFISVMPANTEGVTALLLLICRKYLLPTSVILHNYEYKS